jgi:transposase
MEQAAETIIDEINQIRDQFRSEVSGRRKQWPKSIKSRVVHLLDLGMRPKEIQSHCGISFHTVSLWKSQKSASKFHEIPVLASSEKKQNPATVTVTKKSKRPRLTKSTTVTVKISDAVVVELASVKEVILLIRGLGGDILCS